MTDRAKTIRYASDDDADSLLADILDSTEDRARAEEAALEQTLDANRVADERARAEAHATRLAQRQVKLEKELQRQAELARKRTEKMEALNPTPVAPEPEPVIAETTPSLDEAAIRRQIAKEVREELRVISMTPMPEAAAAPTKNRTGLIAAAAAVLIAGGLGAAMFAIQDGYKPDRNAYAKAVFAPMDREAVALEVGSVPIPKPEPVTVVEDEISPRKAKAPRANTRPTPKEHKPKKSIFGTPTKKSDERNSLDKFDGIFDSSTDPFTME